MAKLSFLELDLRNIDPSIYTASLAFEDDLSDLSEVLIISVYLVQDRLPTPNWRMAASALSRVAQPGGGNR